MQLISAVMIYRSRFASSPVLGVSVSEVTGLEETDSEGTDSEETDSEGTGSEESGSEGTGSEESGLEVSGSDLEDDSLSSVNDFFARFMVTLTESG